jgi:hypothetical protein
MKSNYLPWIVSLVAVLAAGYFVYSNYFSPTLYVTPTSQIGTDQSESGAAGGTMIANHLVTFELSTQSGLGQSGIAIFTKGLNDKVEVRLAMEGGTFTEPQPAHIHLGSCPTPGAVKYPLTDVIDGVSVTNLEVTWDEMMASGEKLAINVHKSAQEVSVYTACGDIPAEVAAVPDPESMIAQ